MNLIYQLGIRLYELAVWVAFPFNEKARFRYRGQKSVFSYLQGKINRDKPLVWVHCASLGEFEQGRPLIEGIKKQHPEYQVLLTFFSPSGYEIRKNYDKADYICYLPADTKENAIKFLNLVQPQMAFFIKYEFWKNYFEACTNRQIPIFLVSAIFRPEQLFFKTGVRAKWYRQVLNHVEHFFVQNKQSAELLAGIGLKNSTVTGDTRFDRVAEIAANRKDLPLVEQFKGKSKLIVVGSSWQPDEEILAEFMTANKDVKMVIAPHEVKEVNIKRLLSLFQPNVTRYSNPKNDFENCRVLIIDSIGLLSSVYRYADIAYVGGGFGVGIHNTLEAAIYNVPVLFGPNYLKFQEAVELVSRNLAFPVKNGQELTGQLSRLFEDDLRREEISEGCRQFMSENLGATNLVLKKVFNK